MTQFSCDPELQYTLSAINSALSTGVKYINQAFFLYSHEDLRDGMRFYYAVCTDFVEELLQFNTIAQNFPSEGKNTFISLLRTLKMSSLAASFLNIEIILRIICN